MAKSGNVAAHTKEITKEITKGRKPKVSAGKQANRRFENDERCAKVLDMFSLFSNELRFKILCALSEGDYCVHELAEKTGGNRSNLSQQLKMLTLAGYLTREREGKQVYYRLEDEKIKKTIEFLHALFDTD